MTLFRATQNASLNGPAFSQSHSGGEVDVQFKPADPETVETIRRHLDEMRRQREAQWIAHCQKLLREGEADA